MGIFHFLKTGTGSKTAGGESLNYLSRLAEIMFPSFFSLARLSIRKTLNRERQKCKKLEKSRHYPKASGPSQ